MAKDKPLTKPQERALALVNEFGHCSSRAIAAAMWPDSPAWKRRTRFGAVSNQGAMGGTMPMKAAQILHRLADKGLIERRFDRYSTTWHSLQKDDNA